MLETHWDPAVTQDSYHCWWEAQLIEGPVIRKPDVRDCYFLNGIYILLESPNVNRTAQHSALGRPLPCSLGSLKDVASCLSSKVSAMPQEKSLLYS